VKLSGAGPLLGGARWGAVELLVATGAVSALVVISAHVPPSGGERAVDATGYGALAVAGVATGLCRRRPRAAAALVTGVLCAFVVRDYPNGPVWLTGFVVLAVLAWRTSRRTAVLGAVVMFGALTVTAVAVGRFPLLVATVFVGWAAAAVFLGMALSSRRHHLAGLAERAGFLQRLREDEAARRVAEERLRIARDLHDGVAHAIATINVQAGAAAHVQARRPEAVGPALAAIQRTSAEVLDELGRMLGVLRGDAVDPAGRVPLPGLGEVGALAASLESSGLLVRVLVEGSCEAVSAGVGTAAYRVVQESLTNVLRHSGAREAGVSVVIDDAGGTVLEVRDPGPARAATSVGSGVGVIGMRERVTATGGRLSAGPESDGGYLVRAQWGGGR